MEVGNAEQARQLVEGFEDDDDCAEAIALAISNPLDGVGANDVNILSVTFLEIRRLHDARPRRLSIVDILIDFVITVPANSAAAANMDEDSITAIQDTLVNELNTAIAAVPSLGGIVVQQITASKMGSRIVMTDGGTITTTGTVAPALGAPPSGTASASSALIAAALSVIFVLGCCICGFCWCYAKQHKGNEDEGLADGAGAAAVITPSDMHEVTEPPADGNVSDEEGPVAVHDVVVGHSEQVKQFNV